MATTTDWTPLARRVDAAVGAPPAPDLPANALAELVQVAHELQAEEIDLERLLPLIAAKAAEVVHTDLAWIGLYDQRAAGVRVVATHGVRTPDFANMTVPLDAGLGGVALGQRTTLVITDYPHYEHATTAYVRKMMALESVVSVICAPMMRGTTMVGALYVANRSPTRFADEHASIVSTLAAQASVAIQNGRLLRTLLDKTALLEATFDIHRQLGDAAVAGIGVEGVARALGELIRHDLVLEQEIVEPFVLHVGDPVREGPEGSALTDVPIRLGADEVGRITVHGSRALTPLEDNALAHGATVLALELMKHRAAHEVEWRLRDELLQELLEVDGHPSPSAIVRARRFGVDLEEPHRIVVLEAGGPQDAALRDRVRRAVAHRPGIITTGRGEQVVVLLGEDRVAMRALVQAAGAALGVRAGVSSARRDLAGALREATACVRFARAAAPGETVLVEHEQLGGLRFMLDVQDPSQAAAVVRERLGGLAAYDREKNGQLLETLRAHLEEDGRHAAIALRCHVHPSTVKYRLRRIAQLLGEPPADAPAKFELLLAFRLLDLFRGIGVDLLEDGAA